MVRLSPSPNISKRRPRLKLADHPRITGLLATHVNVHNTVADAVGRAVLHRECKWLLTGPLDGHRPSVCTALHQPIPVPRPSNPLLLRDVMPVSERLRAFPGIDVLPPQRAQRSARLRLKRIRSAVEQRHVPRRIPTIRDLSLARIPAQGGDGHHLQVSLRQIHEPPACDAVEPLADLRQHAPHDGKLRRILDQVGQRFSRHMLRTVRPSLGQRTRLLEHRIGADLRLDPAQRLGVQVSAQHLLHAGMLADFMQHAAPDLRQAGVVGHNVCLALPEHAADVGRMAGARQVLDGLDHLDAAGFEQAVGVLAEHGAEGCGQVGCLRRATSAATVHRSLKRQRQHPPLIRLRGLEHRSLLRIAGIGQQPVVPQHGIRHGPRCPDILIHERDQQPRLGRHAVAERVQLLDPIADAHPATAQRVHFLDGRHQVVVQPHRVQIAARNRLPGVSHSRSSPSERRCDIPAPGIGRLHQPRQRRRIAIGPVQDGITQPPGTLCRQLAVGVHDRGALARRHLLGPRPDEWHVRHQIHATVLAELERPEVAQPLGVDLRLLERRHSQRLALVRQDGGLRHIDVALQDADQHRPLHAIHSVAELSPERFTVRASSAALVCKPDRLLPAVAADHGTVSRQDRSAVVHDWRVHQQVSVQPRGDILNLLLRRQPRAIAELVVGLRHGRRNVAGLDQRQASGHILVADPHLRLAASGTGHG